MIIFENTKQQNQRILKFFRDLVIVNALLIIFGDLGISRTNFNPEGNSFIVILFGCLFATVLILSVYSLNKHIEKVAIDEESNEVIVFYSRCFWLKKNIVIDFKNIRFKPKLYVSIGKVYYIIRFQDEKSSRFKIDERDKDYSNEDFKLMYEKFSKIEIHNRPEKANKILKLVEQKLFGKGQWNKG